MFKMFLTSLVLFGVICPAWTGDKLIITGARARVDPGKERKAGDESDQRIGSLVRPPSGYDASGSRARYQPRTLNPKLQKRLENQRIERENWVFLAPGELQNQEAEEGDLGVRQYRHEDIQRKVDVRDYTFYNLDRSKNSESSSQVSSDTRRALEQSRLSRSSMSDSETQRGSGLFKSPNTDNQSTRLGAHFSKELNLRNLLGPRQNNSGSLAGQGNDGQAPFGNFGRNSDRPASFGSSKLGGLTDPVNGSSDATLVPLNPVTGGSIWSSTRRPDNTAFSNPQTPAKGSSSLNPGSQRSLGPSSLTPFSSLPSPNARQVDSPLLNQNSSPSLGAPRRKF